MSNTDKVVVKHKAVVDEVCDSKTGQCDVVKDKFKDKVHVHQGNDRGTVEEIVKRKWV